MKKKKNQTSIEPYYRIRVWEGAERWQWDTEYVNAKNFRYSLGKGASDSEMSARAAAHDLIARDKAMKAARERSEAAEWERVD